MYSAITMPKNKHVQPLKHTKMHTGAKGRGEGKEEGNRVYLWNMRTKTPMHTTTFQTYKNSDIGRPEIASSTNSLITHNGN